MEEQSHVQSIRIDKMRATRAMARLLSIAPTSGSHDDVNSENARILIPEILASLTLIGNVSSELR
jgi:hypothetical protein